MKRIFVATFILFCAAVLISQWRRPHTGGNPTHDLTQKFEQTSQTEHQFPPPRAIRSLFTTLARGRSASIPTNTLPERILVEWGGRWYPAEIVESDGSRHLIRYTGYGDEWNEWVGPARIRDAALPASGPEVAAPDEPRLQPQAGDFVVKWGNRWWRAQVLQQNGEQTLIRYVGYGSEWDEWVTPDRAKVFTEADAAANTVTETEPMLLVDLDGLDITTPPSSAQFLVEWSGRWWPADVLAKQEGKYFIHYEGYGNNWDEWITANRLRVPEQQPK